MQRRSAMQRRFGYTDRESLSKMTNVDAQEIMTYLQQLEFPRIFLSSLQFALFKTYGIPTISGLLAATKQFSTPENASKRSDIVVNLTRVATHHPRDERAIKAIARMNTIHAQYLKAGKISNDDLLYTLSQWRIMTDVEICAIATFWKSLGDDMGISYVQLRRSEAGWENGLDFYDDIKKWAENYEMGHMVPAATNKKTADELGVNSLHETVESLKPFKFIAANTIGVLMGSRLRISMIRYLVHPYYNKPGLWNRWGPWAWFVYFSGGDVPGSKSSLYMLEGYAFEEIGPDYMKNRGLKEMRVWEEMLEAKRLIGCPFNCSK
ncbi:hypothetical protein OIDMADRAFT_45571 [Oidiodendron maius Zn]|uniref:ER-bound oxygenase mpaB/mpaB'/Rubber oxygenase catalytic domain-containing protein n=1 Tax=Oidiodendron maius (strain Zn) TaxID=913774 RepID=A0A0C3GEK4_OIDMZ|nr:hypothetical protein OIDMADRAFT_45571 [Oidiodendron maius Zn]